MSGHGNGALLDVRGLVVHFHVGSTTVRAVDGIDFAIRKGETLGLVGESGCGKSTVARTIVGLVPATAGSATFDGRELLGLSRAAYRPLRRRIQMVFQDPYASLNPRMTVASIIGEPMEIHATTGAAPLASSDRRPVPRATIDARVCELMQLVGLDASMRRRYPHEFSGGQRQRIGLARALALEPDLILLDEPVSALDVSVQSQVLNLLEDLKSRLGLTYLFIAHHLAVVRHVSDRVAVMYLGRIVEIASRDSLYTRPLHPYTHALMSAIPIPDPVRERERRRIPLQGEIPSPTKEYAGCRFYDRCPARIDRCKAEDPPLEEYGSGHFAACWVTTAEGLPPGSMG